MAWNLSKKNLRWNLRLIPSELAESKMKTVLNREKEFGYELDKLVEEGKLVTIKCKTWQKYESLLKTMRRWVQGSKFCKEGSLKDTVRSFNAEKL